MANIIDEIERMLTESADPKQLENILIESVKSNYEIDPEILTLQSQKGKDLFSLAARYKLDNLMIVIYDFKPDIVKKRSLDFDVKPTRLHYAAYYKCRKFLTYVLSKNPKLMTMKDINGETVLHWSANQKLENVLMDALRVEPTLLEIQNNKGQTVLQRALSVGISRKIVDKYKKAKSKPKNLNA